MVYWQTGLGCSCSDLKVFLTFLNALNAGTTPRLALSPRETSGLFQGWKTCTGKSSYLHKTYTAEDEAADTTITLPLQASSMAVQPGHSWVGPIRRLPPLSVLCCCLEIHHQLASIQRLQTIRVGPASATEVSTSGKGGGCETHEAPPSLLLPVPTMSGLNRASKDVLKPLRPSSSTSQQCVHSHSRKEHSSISAP